MATDTESGHRSLNRRAFLQQASSLISASLLPLPAWSGTTSANPGWVVRPRSVSDLAKALKHGPAAVRPSGASLSSSGLNETKGTHLDLRYWAGAVSWNDRLRRMRFRSGSTLDDVATALDGKGLALPVFGDMPAATIGGAISTGTHGGRWGSSSLSGLVTAAQLLTAEGDRIEISERDNASLLPAVACGLGCLGVITEVELAAEPAERLHEDVRVLKWREALSEMEEMFRTHRHAETYLYPQINKAVLRHWDVTTQPSSSSSQDDWKSKARELVVELGHEVPPLDAWAQHLLVLLARQSSRTGPSHRMLMRATDMQFAVMEYALPIQHAAEVLEGLAATLRRSDASIVHPIRLRPVAEDVAWISPFYRQNSVCIELRCKNDAKGQALLARLEPQFKKHHGRPHWGLHHEISAREAAEMYPRWDEFRALRQRLDPRGRLLNAKLKTLLA